MITEAVWQQREAAARDERADTRDASTSDLLNIFATLRDTRIARLEAIPDEDWPAEENVLPEDNAQKVTDWHTLVAPMTPVQKIVHLAMRMADPEIERLQTQLLRVRRRAYENELTNMARAAGCPKRKGFIREGRLLKELSDLCKLDAQKIANTYNSDLSRAIMVISTDVPTANRHVYAARLRTWEENRDSWKAAQIAQYTEGTTRASAQSAFYAMNNLSGQARVISPPAQCPVCMGWINRGWVDALLLMQSPPPYHLNCPHTVEHRPEQVADCSLLWTGE